MKSDDPATNEFVPGRGKISASISIFLGLCVLGAVLCLKYPHLLTIPDARALYPIGTIRIIIQVCLFIALGFGCWAVLHGNYQRQGLMGIAIACCASLLGGSTTEIPVGAQSEIYLGLDWFVMNLLILAVIFVPLERAFAKRKKQKLFRKGFRVDLSYFFTSHAAAQIILWSTTVPVFYLLGWAESQSLQQLVSTQWFVLQFIQILFLADLFSYFAHRAFHEIPFLWKFHAIHHSSTEIDWLAGSRLHIVDVIVTRGMAFIPLYLLGFHPIPLYAYLTFVSFHAVFIHANVNFNMGVIQKILVTPRYHHWHHSSSEKVVNKNYAVHLPIIDKFFGTQYFPEIDWPEEYGIAGNPVPEGFLDQVIYPFTKEE